jgi:hypothetical protein
MQCGRMHGPTQRQNLQTHTPGEFRLSWFCHSPDELINNYPVRSTDSGTITTAWHQTWCEDKMEFFMPAKELRELIHYYPRSEILCRFMEIPLIGRSMGSAKA